MTVFTILAGFLGIIVGIGAMYWWYKRKLKQNVEKALKTLEDIKKSENGRRFYPELKSNHTLKSEGVDLPEKEGGIPTKQDSDATESSDLTATAPSSNINEEKDKEVKDETN